MEEELQGQWDESLVLSFDCLQCSHRVCLACPCLAIDKDATIAAFKDMVKDWSTCLAEDSLLLRILIKNFIKVELVDFFLKIKCNSLLDQLETSLREFVPEWSDPNEHLNL